MGQTLAGPRLAGRWIGLQNCVANVSGIVGPAVSGFIVDRTGNFNAAFTLAAGVTAVGAFAWTFGIRRATVGEPVPAPASV
jgi:cyanate permease